MVYQQVPNANNAIGRVKNIKLLRAYKTCSYYSYKFIIYN